MKKVGIFIGLTFYLSFILITSAVGIVPGSEGDPVVTLGYVEKRLSELKSTIMEDVDSSGSSERAVYEVVNLEKGQKIIFGHSTEVILRAGQASAIVSEQGGLSDITTGIDIGDNEEIPKNHLLIIPRDDGRGFNIHSTVYVMVKGDYKIEQ